MTRKTPSRRRLFVRSFQWCGVVALPGLLLAACSGNAAQGQPASETAEEALLIGQENTVRVLSDNIVVGPIVSGQLRPEREAVLRAQLGGAMLEVTVREGQAVSKGMLLGRIDARTIEDARMSAASAVRSAESQLAVAQREHERTAQLVDAGALAAREVDLARNVVATAEAQVADARSRLVTVQQQLADAEVRAPIAGVVADRAVNAGDIVAPGTELFTIVDPSSMRLDASVPSESLPDLRVGATVLFEVRGYPQPFAGRIARIAPRTDPSTRQVPIYVEIPNTGGRLVGGLFAEGRVVRAQADGVVVPVNAINMTGPEAWALRVVDGRTERVPVSIGLHDPRTERVQVTAGLSEGDIVLRGAAQGIAPGTPVQVSGPRQ